MAEAEDVLTDVARHATVFARDLWRKHRVKEAPHLIGLADVASRLDLLVNSVFGRHFNLRTAQLPARPTLLATILRYSQSPSRTSAIPATNNQAIWLPAHLHISDEMLARETYRLIALQQAMRAQRRSADFILEAKNPLWRDLYLLLEAQASDRDLVKLLPGLKLPLKRFRDQQLRVRPSLDAFSAPRRKLEEFYRSLLSDCLVQPALPDPSASISEAELLFKKIQCGEQNFSLRTWSGEPLLKDWWTGELHAAETEGKSATLSDDHTIETEKPPRSARLNRRPDIRDATEDEDKPDPSAAWMVQGEESHPHAEDPMGLQRPIDRDNDKDAAEFGDLVSELAQARLVSTPSQPKEILLSDDPPDPQANARENKLSSDDKGLDYPEWDYRTETYRQPGTLVMQMPNASGSQLWVDQTLRRHSTLIESIRRRFEMLQARRTLHRKQLDGEEIDLDAYIASRADVRGGGSSADAFYQTRRVSDRSLAISLLMDVSGSTDSWVAENRRVIDVEREALLLVCIALESLGEPFSVLAFSGDGMRAVKVLRIKSFKEHFNNEVALRISALEPENYTRAGAALRHAASQLLQNAAANKLLILLSDGKPHDKDIYESQYGIEDTRQAVLEAKLQGITTFCLTIDRQAADYLPRIFGRNQYALLSKPELLPKVLLEWIKRLLAM